MLTGVITDQQVTVSNRIRAQLAGIAVGNGGYVGQTTGSPTGGPYNAGDFAMDITNFKAWLCTVAGSPGTWKSVTFA